MEKVEQLIGTLQKNINRLVEENNMLKQRVSALDQESSGYRILLEEREKALENLESTAQAVTAARNIQKKTDPEKVKGKIDELVREIDRCIHLLNR